MTFATEMPTPGRTAIAENVQQHDRALQKTAGQNGVGTGEKETTPESVTFTGMRRRLEAPQFLNHFSISMVSPSEALGGQKLSGNRGDGRRGPFLHHPEPPSYIAPCSKGVRTCNPWLLRNPPARGPPTLDSTEWSDYTGIDKVPPSAFS